MLIRKSIFNFGLLLLLLMAVLAGAVHAQVEPDRSGLGQAEFRLDELNIQHDFRLPHNLPGPAASIAQANLAALGLSANRGRVDIRGGRWATLLTAEPLLPGKGVGNQLNWKQMGQAAPKNDAERSAAASQAFRDFLDAAGNELQIDLAELGNDEKVTPARRRQYDTDLHTACFQWYPRARQLYHRVNQQWQPRLVRGQ